MERWFAPLLLLLALAAACKEDDACDVFENAGCIEMDRILADVEFLSSAAMGGRRAGFPGNALAVDYVEARFAQLGLPPPPGADSRLQSFPIDVWVAESPPTLKLGDLEFTVGVGEGLDAVENSGSGSVIDAPVVFAGHGVFGIEPSTYSSPICPVAGRAYDDFAPLGDLTGKVVVLLEDVPNWDTCYGPITSLGCWQGGAGDRGAAAVILAPAAHSVRDQLSITGAGCDDIPVVRISREVLEATFRRSASGRPRSRAACPRARRSPACARA